VNVPRDPVPNFFGSLIQPFDDPAVAILPVAYERTVSYESGASAGPRAILTASAQLELYEMELTASRSCNTA
jgi:arginase family enzyme